MPTRIRAFCGSLRAASMNAAPPGATIRLASADANLPCTLTTPSARLLPGACLGSRPRSTGITGQGILDPERAARIGRALTLLASGAPRA